MKEAERFVAFLAVGGFASVVNLLARLIFDTVTSYEVAIILAFPVALTTAFLLNRAFVFRSGDGAWGRQYWRFLLVNLATLGQIFLVSVALARFIFPASGFTWHADTVAHAIGLIAPIFTSYWIHKRFSFAPAEPSAQRAP